MLRDANISTTALGRQQRRVSGSYSAMTSARRFCALRLPGDLADAVVVGVADVDGAIGADDRTMRTIEAGRGRWAAVAARALAAAGDRHHHSAAVVDPADRMIFGIDDQQAAVA